jgi:hypothetical protein
MLGAVRRIGIEQRALGVPPAIVVLVLGVASCGGGSASTSSVAGPARVNHEGTSPGSELYPHHAAGDYDSDDYGPGGDADDDDSVGRLDRDGDTDSQGAGNYDSDDSEPLAFGHRADRAETRAAAVLVRRYLAAAAAGDGARACSMVFPTVAKTVPTVLGGVGEPPYSHGKTCAQVVSNIFRFYRAQLNTENRVLGVSEVLVRGDKGTAMLAPRGGSSFPRRVIELRRDGSVWKIDAVLDQEQP